MRGFIAGASRIGLVGCQQNGEARSSACPPAILAIRSAVAGRDHNHVGVAREADVADVEFAARIEQVGETWLPAIALDRQRRDEFVPGLGQHARTAAPRSRSRRIRSSDL
jgi:hypothetical protein